MINDCVKCHRWKIFNDKPCTVHPEFKTDKDIKEEKMQKANDNLQVMFYVAGLRVYAAMGRFDLFEITEMKLQFEPKRIQDAVVAECERRGPMSEEEIKGAINTGIYMMTKGQISFPSYET